MAWLREKVRTWLGVTDNPPVVQPKTNPWDDASYKAQDAGDILVACEKRLANDATLLAMCNEFLGESEEPSTLSITLTGWMVWNGYSDYRYEASAATTAVREERNRIRVRIAEAKLAKVKADLPKKGRR